MEVAPPYMINGYLQSIGGALRIIGYAIVAERRRGYVVVRRSVHDPAFTRSAARI